MPTEEKAKAKVVLVVDDEEWILTMLCQVLKFCGYTTISAANGQEALLQVRNQVPDAIILDIAMPVVDGWEVCRQLKTDPSTEKIPIVFYSTLNHAKDLEKGKRLGADRYVTKENDPMTVVQVLKQLV